MVEFKSNEIENVEENEKVNLCRSNYGFFYFFFWIRFMDFMGIMRNVGDLSICDLIVWIELDNWLKFICRREFKFKRKKIVDYNDGENLVII